MKKKTLLAPFLAFALLGMGCSDDPPASSGGTGGTTGSGGARTGGTSGSGGTATGGTSGSGGTGSGGSATGGTSGSGGTTTDGGSETGAETGGETGGDAPAGEVAAGIDPKASFFITSRNGDGNLGGLTGADTICQTLANSVGLGGKEWKAYLSADTPATNAKDRIGNGPWYNVKGVLIAEDNAKLHAANPANGATPDNAISAATGLTEKGEMVSTSPNQHDIITGSNMDGTLAAGKTCSNWMSGAADQMARVGHHNRMGGTSAVTMSWNSVHDSAGCTLANFNSRGGSGKFYCFAKTP